MPINVKTSHNFETKPKSKILLSYGTYHLYSYLLLNISVNDNTDIGCDVSCQPDSIE